MSKQIFLLIFISFVTACTQKAVVSKTKKNTVKITEYSEDLKSYMPQYSISKPVINTNKSVIITENANPASDNKAVDEILIKMRDFNKLVSDGQGFRIQVFSGNVKADFEEAKMFLMRTYPELDIYEMYSQPTYKIKVGDFLKYADADEYVNGLKSKFGAVRVINDKINIKKALEIK